MSTTKELHFFSGTTWKKGTAWYEQMFDANDVIGESTPSYTLHNSRLTAERMHSLVPNAKLLYIVRDPIDRILSHFCEVAGAFEERREFSEIARDWKSAQGYLSPSKYYFHLSNYLNYFSRDKILVKTTEELRQRSTETIDAILDFIGVSSFEIDTTNALNVSNAKRVPSAFVRKHFPEFLRRQLVLPTWIPARVAKTMKRIILLSGDPLVVPRASSQSESVLSELLRDDVRKLQAVASEADFSDWREY